MFIDVDYVSSIVVEGLFQGIAHFLHRTSSHGALRNNNDFKVQH